MKINSRQTVVAAAILSALFNTPSVYADDDVMGEVSLEDLLSLTTDIASNVQRSLLEQPSILSVISRQQIMDSGARDLKDIIRMVPGFGFAHDTAGINSWGFRGVWGHEGKIMLIIDGAPYNDAAWGNLQFGRHYPAELIERVEVIRGPGAAKFGNYAELAVVRVTTVGRTVDGGFVDVNARSLSNSLGAIELSAAYGFEAENEVRYASSFHLKHGNRTAMPFTNADQSISTYQDNSPIDVLYWDARAKIEQLELSTVYERYHFVHNESIYFQSPDPDTTVDQDYRRFHLAADYSKEINEQWSFKSNLLYQETMSHGMDIVESDEFALGSHYTIDTERYIASADAIYQMSETSSINFGAEYFNVTAKSRAIGEYFVDASHVIPGDSTDFTPIWFDGFTSDSLSFNQKSLFFQYENYNDVVNFTIGARYASHSRSTESVVVPRIGLSKKWGDFGAKLMYSEAFRTGDAEHLNLAATPLKPETLDSMELELHYVHETGLYTINFFSMEINDSIVWNTDALTENQGEMLSDGVEASWVNKGDKLNHEVTLSYYKGDENSTPSQLAIDKESYLAFPMFKATYALDYKVSEVTKFNMTIVHEGEKYWRANLEDITQDVKMDATTLVNFAVTHQLNDSTNLTVSLHDALNEGYYYPQAYGQTLYPGESREVSLSLDYKF